MSEQQANPHSRMDHGDWMDIAESEFVDFGESELGTKVSFIFEHEEIGLHGFTFDKTTGAIEPVAFERND